MDIVVKKLFFVFGIVLLLGVLVSAGSVGKISTRAMHEQYAVDNPSLNVDDATALFNYYQNDPINAEENVLGSEVGGVFAAASAAYGEWKVSAAGIFDGEFDCEETDLGNNLNHVKGTNIGFYENGTSFNVSDYCLDQENIVEYWCNPELQVNTYNCKDYFSDWACFNGRCVQEDSQCMEDDGGNRLYLRGNSQGRYSNSTSFSVLDYCADSYMLVEYSCNPSLQPNTYDCRNYGLSCLNGACIPLSCEDRTDCEVGQECNQDGHCIPENPSHVCMDTDEDNYYIFGRISGHLDNATSYSYNDTCVNSSTLREMVCYLDGAPGQTDSACPNGCLNGVCVDEDSTENPTCTDTDGGRNYNVKGSGFGLSADNLYYGFNDSCYQGEIWDKVNNCSGANCYLTEAYCGNIPTMSGIFLRSDKDIVCVNGCSDGACINSSQTCTPTQSNASLCGSWQCGEKINSCNQTVICGTGCSTDASCNNLGQCVPAGGNLPPTNLTIAGPTSIASFGTSTSWQISARDPDGGYLRYIVYFGDGQYSEYPNKANGVPFSVSHVYNKLNPNDVGATYQFKLIVKDDIGLQAEKIIGITVGTVGGNDVDPSLNKIVVTKPTAGTYATGSIMEINWTAPSTVPIATIYAMTKLSSGAWSSNLIATNVPSAGGGQYNYLLGAAGTNIQVIGRDSATGEYLSDLSDTYTITTSSSSDFAVGGRVKSFHPEAVWINVYSDVKNAQPLTKKMPIWIEGTIKTGSPKFFESDLYKTEGWYWNIDFDSPGTDGWVSEKQLISKAKSADIVGYFAKGGKVQVISESYPRITPNGNNNYYDFDGDYIQQPQGQVGTAYYKNIGVIVDDVQEVGGKVWLKVDFASGTDGWMDRSVLVTTEDDGTNTPFALTTDSLKNPINVYVGIANIWTLKGNVPSGSASGCTGSQGVLYEVNFGDGTKTRYVDNCLGGIMGYAGESAMKHTYLTNGIFNITGKATSNITGWNGTATRILGVSVSPKP